MNKDYLKQYIRTHGGINVISDIASILQDLSQEWGEAGHKSLQYTFSDAANMIADASNKLNIAECEFISAQEIGTPTHTSERDKYQAEFDKLMSYFQTLSMKEFRFVFFKNKAELLSKLKRLDFLKKALSIKDDSKK